MSAAELLSIPSPVPRSDDPIPELSATGLTKRFGAFVALEDVSLTLRPNTVHALLGENGAGKSTLVKCLMGFHHADAGVLRLDGREVRLESPRAAQALGIGMVYQHFTLVPNLTVAENLVIARSHLPMVLDWKKEQQALTTLMASMPFQLDPRRLVSSLAAGERQKLEIIKQLSIGSRILILDEPTSVLTPSEADDVLGLLHGMARAGKLSVLLITHKFREVLAYADQVTVLRRGRFAGSGAVKDLSVDAMAAMMVGTAAPLAAVERGTAASGETLLELRGVEAASDQGVPALRGVSLKVRAGEIVGIAGVSGNGQDELVEVLAGQRVRRGGEIAVNGEAYSASRSDARRHGFRCLPEEPLRNACVAELSVSDNLAFRLYDRPAFTRGGFFVRRSRLREHAEACVKAYKVKTASVDSKLGSLSGGNVQRAVLAREIDEDARLLLVANPCFGLDFGATAEVRARLIAARNRGVGVLLVSADLDEIFALADRILVMSEGRVVHEAETANTDPGAIGRYMAGHS